MRVMIGRGLPHPILYRVEDDGDDDNWIIQLRLCFSKDGL